MRQETQQQVYEVILALFRSKDYQSISFLTWDKMGQILNERANKVIGEDFQTQILQDIWERSLQKTQGDVRVVTLAQTFVEAMEILKNRISLLEGQFGLIMDRRMLLEEKQYELSLYEEQTDYGNKHIFHLQGLIERIKEEIQSFQQDHQLFKKELRLIETIFLSQQRHKYTFYHDEYLEQEEPRLKQLFFLLIISIILEIYLLKVRPSMLALLCYLEGLFVLFVGYLYAKSVAKIEVHLGVCLMCDLTYLLVYGGQIFGYESVNSTLPQQGILKWVFIILMLLTLVFRLVMMWKWRKFVEIAKKSYYFILFGAKIKLNKRVVIK